MDFSYAEEQQAMNAIDSLEVLSEEEAERQADVEYWRPLKERLTQLRWEMRRSRSETR